MGYSELLSRLVACANPDGGWGYQVGKASHPEPTCLALLALRTAPEAFAAAISAGLAALERHRQPDGGYRLAQGRPEAEWSTAIALFTKLVLGASPGQMTATISRLLAIESRIIERSPETSDMENDIDLKLVGWPWAAANFGWVEPTAWACLALRAAGFEQHPRVQEGLRLLLDRAFDTGGANYGNRVVLGTPTEPIPGPTAIFLAAVQGAVEHPRIDASVGYLRVSAAHSDDLEHLAWSRIALGLYDHDSATRELLPELERKILTLAADPQTSPLHLALAAIAIAPHNPFRLRSTVAPPEDVPLPRRRQGRGILDRIAATVRGVMVAGISQLKPLPATSAVHIARVPSYDEPLLEVLTRQFEHFRSVCPMAGKRVVIKPNLVEYRPQRVINTDIRVIDAVIGLCKNEGAAEVVVAEGPGHWRNTQFLVRESGLEAVLQKHHVPFVDVNHDEPVKVMNLGRLTRLDYLYVSRTVHQAEVLISLAKLKTHHWAGVTLSLKNLFGILPGICYGWPKNELHWRGIPQSVVDIACTCPPQLAIVDAIVGMEGDGPLHGTAKHVGALVMGVDPLAVDATCTRLMGFPPERIPTLVLAQARRLGRLHEAEIPQLGESIAALAQPFAWPPLIERQLLPERRPAASEGNRRRA
ncbi:MAG: DUF362 domain-containing protein [Gemmataceae bacterium]|nr:DUF362 domain-containing protein [Gemmata sp.]MDW8196740.1 DUF362 domain-containing protein [Gemmataceae bacterium]